MPKRFTTRILSWVLWLCGLNSVVFRLKLETKRSSVDQTVELV